MGMNGMNSMNGANNMNGMNNMNSLNMMNMMNGGGLTDVNDMFSNQVRQQQMAQLQQYADNTQDPVCPQVKAYDRQSCERGHSGNMMQDMNMCQAKGCCFDASMWGYIDQENEKAKEQSTNANRGGSSPFTSSSSSNSPFNSNSPFRRGKRSTGQRSSQLAANPFSPNAINGQTELCRWHNPFDGMVGLESLQNVIKPCCKKVWCYSAQSTSLWSAWSPWSECKGLANEVAPCPNIQPCPRMLQWSQWTTCSSQCGQGTRTRKRSCTVLGGCANEMPYEDESCMVTGCFSDWTQWSTCDSQCGGGRSSRQRVCLELDQSMCRGQTNENRLCNTQFCENWGSYEPVGACQNERGCGMGYQSFKRTCIGGVQGAPGCQGSDSKQGTCNLPDCPSWTSWSQFTACENKVRTRTRACTNGVAGQDCAGQAFETKPCWSGSSFGGNSWGSGNNWSQWGAWGPCQNNMRCRTRTCSRMGMCGFSSATDSQQCGNANSSGWNFNNFANSFFGK